MWDKRITETISELVSDPVDRIVAERSLRAMFADTDLSITDPNEIYRAALWLSGEVRKEAAWLSDEDVSTWSPAKLRELKAASLKLSDGRIDIPFCEGDEIPVKEYGDGWTLVRLATHEAATRETRQLGAGPFFEGVFVDGDLEAGRKSLWLLRDASGAPQAMMSLNRLAICNAVGWRREPLSRQIVDTYLMPLVEEFGLRLMTPTSMPGKVRDIEGSIHDLRELPDGITIDGDLVIQDSCPDIMSLPDNLTVTGDLVIWANHNIERIPRNLHVGGMGMSECSRLRTVGEGLRVAGYTSFQGSNSLQVIERDCVFGQGVRFPGNEKLMSQKFTSGGDVQIGDKTIDGKLFAAVNGRGAGAANFASGVTAVVELVKMVLPRVPARLQGTRRNRYDFGSYRDDRMLAIQAEMDAEIEARTVTSATPSL